MSRYLRKRGKMMDTTTRPKFVPLIHRAKTVRGRVALALVAVLLMVAWMAAVDVVWPKSSHGATCVRTFSKYSGSICQPTKTNAQVTHTVTQCAGAAVIGYYFGGPKGAGAGGFGCMWTKIYR